MFAAIFIPDFSLQAVLRSEPELSSKPVALVDSGAPRFGVLQLTSAARTAGVREGQTPSQATARCATLKIKSRSFPQEEIASQLLLQTAFSYSPRVEATASGICTLDLQGLPLGLHAQPCARSSSPSPRGPRSAERSSLVGQVTGGGLGKPLGRGEGEPYSHSLTHSQLPSPPPDARHSTLSQKWCSNILRQLSQFHLSARIGISSTPSLALLAARHAQPTLILNDPTSFVADLPIAALEPDLEIAEILNLWGIRTAGQFLALGKEQVVERLGPAALNLFNRAALDSVRPLRLALQPEEFVEQIEFENEIETLEPLLVILRQFVAQLAARLGCLHLVIGELDLRLGLSSGVEHREQFKIPVPTGDVKTLCRLLDTRLENVRTNAAIGSLRLEARPAPPDANQLGLFVTTLVNPNQFAETLGRLSSLCGNERVGIPAAEATLRPDAFRMKSPQLTEEPDFGSASDWTSARVRTEQALHPGSLPEDGARTSVRSKPDKQNERKIGGNAWNTPELLRTEVRAPVAGELQSSAKRKSPRPEKAIAPAPLGLQLRRFRPPLAAKIEFRDEQPAVFRSSSFGGTITDTRGPFVTSGEWWDQNAWSRSEWDVQISDGAIYRLVRTPEGHFVEGVYD